MLPALTTLSTQPKPKPRNFHGPIRKYGRLAHINVHYRFQHTLVTTSADFLSRTWARRTQEKSGNFKVLKNIQEGTVTVWWTGVGSLLCRVSVRPRLSEKQVPNLVSRAVGLVPL